MKEPQIIPPLHTLSLPRLPDLTLSALSPPKEYETTSSMTWLPAVPQLTVRPVQRRFFDEELGIWMWQKAKGLVKTDLISRGYIDRQLGLRDWGSQTQDGIVVINCDLYRDTN